MMPANVMIAKKGAFPVAAKGSFPVHYRDELEEPIRAYTKRKTNYGRRGLKRICCFATENRSTVYPYYITHSKKRLFRVSDDALAPLLESVDNY